MVPTCVTKRALQLTENKTKAIANETATQILTIGDKLLDHYMDELAATDNEKFTS